MCWPVAPNHSPIATTRSMPGSRIATKPRMRACRFINITKDGGVWGGSASPKFIFVCRLWRRSRHKRHTNKAVVMTTTYDLLAIGRSSIDLYSNDIGAPFEAITSFAAYVGGCPLNISVGTRRLGLNPALLTAVGEDQVGNFILHFLRNESVDTQFIPRKPGRRSSAVVLGIEPPDRFPLTYYRDNCAVIELTIDDVLASPVAASRALLISGTGLSKEPSRS